MKTARPFLRPPRLRRGARVALVSPAGPVREDRVEAAMRGCGELGWEPRVGASARARSGYLAGSDGARTADLDHAIRDPDVDAIWALRGGYGTMRILDRVDLTPLLTRPKPFIGFSDNTALHLAHARLGLVSFHGPHAGGPFPPFTRDCFERVLCRAEPAGELPSPPAEPPARTLRGGVAEGELIGGNLSLLAATCGTGYSLQAHGRIVVLEEVGEAAYRIDRSLAQLRLAGVLAGAAGLALGRFTERPDGDSEAALEAVLAEAADELGVPAVLGLPVGHIDHNWCLPFCVRARLDADRGTLTLLDAAVT